MAKGFKRTGNWSGVNKLVKSLATDIRGANRVTLMKVGLKAESIAVKHLRDQDLNWTPLRAQTIKSKVRRGGSNKTLINTTDYFQAITSYSDGSTAFAGVIKSAKNQDGTKITTIAMVHEFGSGDIPARPLWRPTFKETLNWIIKDKVFPEEIYKRWSNRL